MTQVFPTEEASSRYIQSSAPGGFGPRSGRLNVSEDTALAAWELCSNSQFVLLVLLLDLLQDVNFQPGCFSVLPNIFYDLQCHLGFASAREETKESEEAAVTGTHPTGHCRSLQDDEIP